MVVQRHNAALLQQDPRQHDFGADDELAVEQRVDVLPLDLAP